MNRLIVAGALAGILVLGCTSTPPSPGTSPLPTVPGISPGTTLPPNGDAALAELCDATNEAGIETVAGDLETVDANTDTAPLQSAVTTILGDLNSVQLTGEAADARAIAVTTLQQAQAGLSNPATVSEAARAAANALRTLKALACQ